MGTRGRMNQGGENEKVRVPVCRQSMESSILTCSWLKKRESSTVLDYQQRVTNFCVRGIAPHTVRVWERWKLLGVQSTKCQAQK